MGIQHRVEGLTRVVPDLREGATHVSRGRAPVVEASRQHLLKIRQAVEPERLNGSNDRSVRGLELCRDLSGRARYGDRSVPVEIARDAGHRRRERRGQAPDQSAEFLFQDPHLPDPSVADCHD
jgi:hypothetical protein